MMINDFLYTCFVSPVIYLVLEGLMHLFVFVFFSVCAFLLSRNKYKIERGKKAARALRTLFFIQKKKSAGHYFRFCFFLCLRVFAIKRKLAILYFAAKHQFCIDVLSMAIPKLKDKENVVVSYLRNIHNSEIPILKYNNENSLSLLVL